MRKHNFSAGPAPLPAAVIDRIKEELGDWRNVGSSVMEISHRSSAFLTLIEEVLVKLRTLLQVPATHQLLFMSGGATAQFSAVPLNLGEGSYLISGHWSRKAASVARMYGRIHLIHDYGEKPTDIVREWTVPSTAPYFHYCHNETVDGVAFAAVPDTQGVPVITDISSCIASQPLDMGRLGLGYACAQKNLGIAGITLIIIREDILEKTKDKKIIPLLNYHAQQQAKSLLNTPDTFAVYVCDLVCDWLLEQGGIAAIAKINRTKARGLYELIDRSDGFYQAPVLPAYRSITNVVFDVQEKEKERLFLQEAEKEGFLSLKGHRARGGVRASIYNAVSATTVNALKTFMENFMRRYG